MSSSVAADPRAERGVGHVEMSPQFPVLDTLRLLGALAVLTTHTTFQTGDYYGNGLWGPVLARLDVGVAIFFVLSGFLLSRPWFARAALGLPRPTVPRFYEKRVLRIFPVYLVTVAVALPLVPGNEPLSWRDWATTLLMLDSFVEGLLPHGLTQMWSLAVEVMFYAALPLLMVLAGPSTRRRPWRLWALLVAMALISLVWHLWAAAELDPVVRGTTGLWLPGYLTWFAAGMLLANADVRSQAGRATRAELGLLRLGRAPGICWSLAAGLMLVAATPLAGPTTLVPPTSAESFFKHVLYALIGTVVVVSGVRTSPGAYRSLMSHPVARHLGHISYSLFCVHVALITLVMGWLDLEPFEGRGLVVWAATLLLSLALSEVLYRVVELPGLRLKDRWRTPADATIQAPTPSTAASTK